MADPSFNGENFVDQAESIILENISNEQFGVSELAEAMKTSRSNLLRKVKKHTGFSASRFIRQLRLEKGMEILGQTTLTVSEVSFNVGFGSTSYFIKCFREYYGFPPGEVARRGDRQRHALKNVTKPMEVYAVSNDKFGGFDATDTTDMAESGGPSYIKWSIIAAAVILLGILAYSTGFFNRESGADSLAGMVDKSIAVLPFKNESSDSSNLYFVNGLMESTLSKLQKIQDLRVISRSSVERYRNTDNTIPEMARELKVNYFVAGSGQKIGDQVLLNIQLIEASSNRQIWAEQYSRKVVDIFELQNEVARKIVSSIEAIVTPVELERIEKKPTGNLLAYDYYLQALDPFVSRTNEGLEQAIGLFEQAIEQDPEFALAYANIAISYYLLEIFQIDKQNTEKINRNADKALLYDSKSAESLIAKAFYYIQTKEYHLALPHLEKALEYNPNSSFAVQMLADFYSRLIPNSDKYLEYALKGVQLNVANDSVTQSYTYLQLSLALVSSGFVDEALKYINMSLDYHAENYYAPHLKAIILFACDGNIDRTRNLVITEWNKDTSRLDILQDVAKFYYVQENYDSAYFYFKKFVSAREDNGLDIYMQENAKIARVYEKMGLDTEARKYFNDFSEYCEQDHSSNRSVNLAVKYAYEGKFDQSIEQLRIFSEVDNYQYWYLLIEDDPLFKPLKRHPEFERLMQKIQDRFWENQARLKESLEEEGLI